MMQVGTVVFSKRGRDKGLPFIVLSVAGKYVYLVDGLLRKLSKPKKKKLMHVQPTNTVVDISLYNQRGLQDADIRKWLKPYSVTVGQIETIADGNDSY